MVIVGTKNVSHDPPTAARIAAERSMMRTPPDWIIRIPDQVTIGGEDGMYSCSVIVPTLEWHSGLDVLHGVYAYSWSRVEDKGEGANRYFKTVFARAKVGLELWWRGWGRPYEDPSFCYIDYHPSYACALVQGWDGHRYVPLYRVRNTFAPRDFDRITAAIARNIADGYDFEALRAALVEDGAS